MVKRGGYLKPWEVSRYLGIPVEEIYAMLEDQELPGTRIEGQWRVPWQALEAWLDEEVTEKELLRLSEHLEEVSPQDVKRFIKERGQEQGQEKKPKRGRRKPSS